MHSSTGPFAEAFYVDYSGEVDYSKVASIGIPTGGDPGSKEFGPGDLTVGGSQMHRFPPLLTNSPAIAQSEYVYTALGFWTEFTGKNSSGWEYYVLYGSRSHAWHSVEYGWSRWLTLDTPAEVRYLRFSWDDNYDVVRQIEVRDG